jgi:hypothetical protein
MFHPKFIFELMKSNMSASKQCNSNMLLDDHIRKQNSSNTLSITLISRYAKEHHILWLLERSGYPVLLKRLILPLDSFTTV